MASRGISALWRANQPAISMRRETRDHKGFNVRVEYTVRGSLGAITAVYVTITCTKSVMSISCGQSDGQHSDVQSTSVERIVRACKRNQRNTADDGIPPIVLETTTSCEAS